jgi:hypothetical protein
MIIISLLGSGSGSEIKGDGIFMNFFLEKFGSLSPHDFRQNFTENNDTPKMIHLFGSMVSAPYYSHRPTLWPLCPVRVSNTENMKCTLHIGTMTDKVRSDLWRELAMEIFGKKKIYLMNWRRKFSILWRPTTSPYV